VGSSGLRRLRALAAGASPGDDWSVEGLRRAASKIATLRMKLAEEDEDHDAAVQGVLRHPHRKAEADAQQAMAAWQKRR